jgi:hypothetical protein
MPLSQPTPAVPRPSSSIATTTTRTLTIPATSVCAVKRPITTLSSRSEAIARQPASIACERPVRTSGAGSPRRPMRAISATTDRSNRPAVAAKTVPVLAAASRSAPSAGPANSPTLSTALATTFAAVSSSGVFTSDGVNATCADRKTGSATATSTESA